MLGVLLLAASLPGLQLKAQTARADWYAQPGLKVKASTCEKALEKAEKIFGVQVARFDYVRVRTQADVGNIAGVYAQGTVLGQTVISTQTCSEHEIVHLVTRQLGVADAIFEEGVAVMLARDTDRVWGWAYRAQARDAARSRHLHYDQVNAILRLPGVSGSEDEYLLAEGWVRDLISHHGGMTSLVWFFQAQHVGHTSTSAFALVYGGTPQDLFDRWLYGKSQGSSRK